MLFICVFRLRGICFRVVMIIFCDDMPFFVVVATFFTVVVHSFIVVGENEVNVWSKRVFSKMKNESSAALLHKRNPSFSISSLGHGSSTTLTQPVARDANS